MRILQLSNFYPPHSLGGYEEWCEEVTAGLRARGHAVRVLASRFRRSRQNGQDPPWVQRDLHLEMEFAPLRNSLTFFTSRHARERENRARLRQLVEAFDPDCILVWGMWNLHRSIAALAERLRPNRVAYYVGDYWPTLPSQYQHYWSSPPRHWVTGALKRPLRAAALRALAAERVPSLEFGNAMFASAFVRDELGRRGLCATRARVVYGGIDTAFFRPGNAPERAANADDVLRLLWVGRLTADKGPDTAIEALSLLISRHGIAAVSLAIAGAGEPAYQGGLKQLAAARGVDHLVHFLGVQSKDALRDLYQRADLFLFTSRWQEPFGRTIAEAMVSGVAVVGAAVGGAAEIMRSERNALLFEPGDPGALAAAVARLARDRALRQALAARGQQDAIEALDIRRMTADIEDFLDRMVADASAAAASTESSIQRSVAL